MQRFHLVFAYVPETGLGTVFEQTWCKWEKDALNRVHSKVPTGGKLLEAWLSEWQNPDAVMELLYGYNIKQEHKELRKLVEDVISKSTEPVLDKLKKSIRGMLTAPAKSKQIAVVETRIKRAKDPMKHQDVYWAISWRDTEKSNG